LANREHWEQQDPKEPLVLWARLEILEPLVPLDSLVHLVEQALSETPVIEDHRECKAPLVLRDYKDL